MPGLNRHALRIISPYVAIPDKTRVNRAFTAYRHVKMSQCRKSFVLQSEKEAQQLEEVVECCHTSGDYDYILKVLVADMAAY